MACQKSSSSATARRLYLLCWATTLFCCHAPSTALTPVVHRRRAVVVGALWTGGSVLTVGGVSTPAAPPATTAEALRAAAASSSRYYGPTDVFYPLDWRGSWTATRTGVESGASVVYLFRFIASRQDDAVVADRAYNQASLEGSSVVASTDWTETNPNVLTVNYSDGGWKELKVTQRATERNGTNVYSSEVYRVTKQSPKTGGVPTIVARRVITKWKELSPNAVEGLELVFDLPQQGGEAQLLGKTRISLRRREEDARPLPYAED